MFFVRFGWVFFVVILRGVFGDGGSFVFGWRVGKGIFVFSMGLFGVVDFRMGSEDIRVLFLFCF